MQNKLSKKNHESDCPLERRCRYYGWIFCILIFITLLGVTIHTSLWINKSESLKGKVFLVFKGLPFKKGDIIGIKSHKTSFGTTNRLLKKVGGTAGDKITVQRIRTGEISLRPKTDFKTGFKTELKTSSKVPIGNLYVNDTYIGPLFGQTEEGHQLAPLNDAFVPENCFFVYGTHPQSFDSRYAEFGFVCPSNEDEENAPQPNTIGTNIIGKACKVF